MSSSKTGAIGLLRIRRDLAMQSARNWRAGCWSENADVCVQHARRHNHNLVQMKREARG